MTALVLCGGGSRGAVEVGLYSAVVELGIPVDLVIGTSVGAINGAAIAAGADIQRYAGQARLIALEPPIGQEIDPLDFRHTDELIEQGYASAMRSLKALLASTAGGAREGGSLATSRKERNAGAC